MNQLCLDICGVILANSPSCLDIGGGVIIRNKPTASSGAPSSGVYRPHLCVATLTSPQVLPPLGSTGLTYVLQPSAIATAAASTQILSLMYSSLALFVPSVSIIFPYFTDSEVQQWVVSAHL